MKRFKFEINLDENDLKGDEFWEQALEKDETGITDLRIFLENLINDSNLCVNSRKPIKPIKQIIKLTEYSDI